MCKRKFKSLVKIILGYNIMDSKQIDCSNERLGTEYGGWVICPDKISEGSIVYSFGVGEDISFDIDIIKKYSVNVFAFDPTPKSIIWIMSQQLPNKFKFYDYGIANNDKTVTFYPPQNPEHVSHTILKRKETAEKAIKIPVKRVSNIMKELGHSHIDILKMYIEGAEYTVINDMLRSGIKPTQLLVEFHHRFNNVSVRKTLSAIKQCNRHGYKIFSILPGCEEYSFLLT